MNDPEPDFRKDVDKTHPLSLEQLILAANRRSAAYTHYQLGGIPQHQGRTPDGHRHTAHIDAPRPDSEIIKTIPEYMHPDKMTPQQLADANAASNASTLFELSPAADTFEEAAGESDSSSAQKSPQELQEYIRAWKARMDPQDVDELIALGRHLERACLCSLLAAQPDATQL